MKVQILSLLKSFVLLYVYIYICVCGWWVGYKGEDKMWGGEREWNYNSRGLLMKGFFHKHHVKKWVEFDHPFCSSNCTFPKIL